MSENGKGKLYEYAVLYHPKPKKVGDDSVTDPSEILVKPTQVIAVNDQQAQILAARAIPESHLDRLELLEIALRPF